jgi:hypothetical protein
MRGTACDASEDVSKLAVQRVAGWLPSTSRSICAHRGAARENSDAHRVTLLPMPIRIYGPSAFAARLPSRSRIHQFRDPRPLGGRSRSTHELVINNASHHAIRAPCRSSVAAWAMRGAMAR